MDFILNVSTVRIKCFETILIVLNLNSLLQELFIVEFGFFWKLKLFQNCLNQSKLLPKNCLPSYNFPNHLSRETSVVFNFGCQRAFFKITYPYYHEPEAKFCKNGLAKKTLFLHVCL